MDLKKHLEKLSTIKGYLGSGVFTGSGEMLEGTSMISGIHQELAGAAINDTLLHAQEMTEDIGMGKADFLQIDSDMGTVITRCFHKGDIHFHTVLYLKKEGNIAMGKLLLKKAIDGLAEEF
jgi:predicted regulator of Ras-like GTPase activity (Roadblock/LC7/MglB family)